MASGSLLRRKVIIGPSYIFNLGHGNYTYPRGFTTFSPEMDSKKNNSYFRNLLSGHRIGKPQVGFFKCPSSTSQIIRYASTHRAWASTEDFQGLSGIESHDFAAEDWRIKFDSKWLPYWFNIKLLGTDLRISLSLLARLFRGKSLSRKESRLLRQTTADIFRLVPGAVSIAVPLNNFLLPVYLKLFPNILPSTFPYKIHKQEPLDRKLKARLAYAEFIQDVAREMAKVDQYSRSGGIRQTAEDFRQFASNIIVGEPVSTEEILGFSKFFSDELTVDYISRPQLLNMCKFTGIPSCGNNDYLRFMLQEKLKSIKKDDKLIHVKGVESLSEAELLKNCIERGIYVAEEMRQQLRDWLNLSLNHSVPSSILILSRAFTMTEKLKPEEAVLATLSSLPYELIHTVVVTSLPFKDPIVGKITKLNSLSLQEKLIKEEQEKELIMLQSDVGPNGIITSSPEQARARAVDKQEQLCELSSHALAVLSSALHVRSECEKFLRLVNMEIHLYYSIQDKGVDGKKEDMKAYRAASEEIDQDTESSIGDGVSSILTNKAIAMFQNLDDVNAKSVKSWPVLHLCCDGKVSPEVVAAASYIKDALHKEGIQELINNLSNNNEVSEKWVGAEDVDANDTFQ